MINDREHWLARTLVELADTLADDFDLVELLTRLLERSVELLGAVEAGIMLAGDDGTLEVMVSTSERMSLLELLEVQSQEGPCLDAFRGGVAVSNVPLDGARWPSFAPRAVEAGFGRVDALPLRHGAVTLGALNVFHADGTASSPADLDLAQSLADIATISILQHRALDSAVSVGDQLQRALLSRVVIEQAKGALVGSLSIDVATAFELLRGFAREHHEHIADVARRVVDGALPATQLVDEARLRHRRREQRTRSDR